MNYSNSLVGHLGSPSTTKGADPAPEISSKRTEENRKEPVIVKQQIRKKAVFNLPTSFKYNPPQRLNPITCKYS
jgi:hypothetical protein